jgi:glucosyl-3-phosphoglycerate phosphatase
VTRLLLWRHGETEWNASHRFQGQVDALLNELGHSQAKAAAAVLARQRPDVIVSSDLRRAAETAGALAAITGLPVNTDARLRERYFGEWQGKTRAEVALAHPIAAARLQRGEPIDEFGIESTEDLAKRVAAGVQDAIALAGSGTVVLATHGAAARYVLGELLGWSDLVIRRLGTLGNCHWTELEYDDQRGWLLRAHNVGVPPLD